MFIDRKFPKTRLRRLRANTHIAELVAESSLSQKDLIQPLFVKENLVGTEAIESMPGISRFSEDSILKEIEEVLETGIKSIALFPVIDKTKKDSSGKEAINKSNLICNSIRKIKDRFPEIVIIADVALDPYTDHGHDGLLVNGYVDNDLTLDILKSQSLVLAEAGADILAPSDMMDGRIGHIREALEDADYKIQFYFPMQQNIIQNSMDHLEMQSARLIILEALLNLHIRCPLTIKMKHYMR